MTAIITIKQEKDAVIKEIEAVAIHEKKSKTMISGIAFEVLAHAVQHGDITLCNRLVSALTPANRLAVVQLFQDCTLFMWDSKERQFKGKSKTGSQAEKDLNLTKFVKIHNGDLWSWYEEEKAKDNEKPKFNAASLAKIIAAYAFGNNNSLEGIDAEIAKAKEAAKKTIAEAPLIDAKTAQLVAAGLSLTDAKKQAQKMAKDGKLQPVESVQEAA